MNDQEKALMLASLILHRVAFGNDNIPPKEELLAAKEHVDALLKESIELRSSPRAQLNACIGVIANLGYTATLKYHHQTGHPGSTFVDIRAHVTGGQFEYVSD